MTTHEIRLRGIEARLPDTKRSVQKLAREVRKSAYRERRKLVAELVELDMREYMVRRGLVPLSPEQHIAKLRELEASRMPDVAKKVPIPKWAQLNDKPKAATPVTHG